MISNARNLLSPTPHDDEGLGAGFCTGDLGPYSPNELRMLRHLTLSDFAAFFRVHHRNFEGTKAITNWHHLVIIGVLEEVFKGMRSHVIINEPPGYTKTLLVVRYFLAWVLAHNARARNLTLSYSSDLADGNSGDVRSIVQSDLYQALYAHRTVRADKSAARHWELDAGGGLRAAPTGGQVTGFRAGRLEDGFQGVLTWDDPIKPDDALFKRIRTRTNQAFNRTLKSRLARPGTTPVVVVAQRLAEDDPSGFLLRGGSGDVWDHLVIPAEIEEHPPPYPAEYTHGRPIIYHAVPGPTWPLKLDQVQIGILKTDPVTWYTQYQQRPLVETGGIFDPDWWVYYDAWDPVEALVDGVRLRSLHIYADTALKTEEQNDYSVVQLWGSGTDGRIYILDQIRGKWTAPELESRFLSFCESYEYRAGVNNMGCRDRAVEDKASGTGLIQGINLRKGAGYVRGIPRDKDKVSRAKSGAPWVKRGAVCVPRSAPWLRDYLSEFALFSSDDSHRNDDQIDPTLDAIHDLLIASDRRIDYGKVV